MQNKALPFITYQNHVNTITISGATRPRITHVLTSELILNLTIVTLGTLTEDVIAPKMSYLGDFKN